MSRPTFALDSHSGCDHAERLHITELVFHGTRNHAGYIDVLKTKNPGQIEFPCQVMRDPGSSEVSKVKSSRRRGSKSDTHPVDNSTTKSGSQGGPHAF